MTQLSQAQFQKFLVRAEVLAEYHKRKAYSDVVREGQEALEIFLKALLMHIGVTPSFSHDPGKELAAVKDKIPKTFAPLAEDFVKWSKRLRKDRELAFYGAKDFIPTEEFTQQDAQSVLDFIQETAAALKKHLSQK